MFYSNKRGKYLSLSEMTKGIRMFLEKNRESLTIEERKNLYAVFKYLEEIQLKESRTKLKKGVFTIIRVVLHLFSDSVKSFISNLL